MKIQPVHSSGPAANDADFDETIAGWDPYILSIISGARRPFFEERRRKPRPLNTARRRSLLLSRTDRR